MPVGGVGGGGVGGLGLRGALGGDTQEHCRGGSDEFGDEVVASFEGVELENLADGVVFGEGGDGLGFA